MFKSLPGFPHPPGRGNRGLLARTVPILREATSQSGHRRCPIRGGIVLRKASGSADRLALRAEWKALRAGQSNSVRTPPLTT